MNGMMVTVDKKVMTEPSARGSPVFVPEAHDKRPAINHSTTPRNQLPLGYQRQVQPEDERAVADIGINTCASYSNHFLVSEQHEDDDHRAAYQVVIQIGREKGDFANRLPKSSCLLLASGDRQSLADAGTGSCDNGR